MVSSLYSNLGALAIIQILFWVYGLYARQNQLEHKFFRMDTPIYIVKIGLLDESKTSIKISDACAFVFFDGISDDMDRS